MTTYVSVRYNASLQKYEFTDFSLSKFVRLISLRL
jgi:hypothetical protein